MINDTTSDKYADIGNNNFPSQNAYDLKAYKIAVLIPCFNEEATIGTVVNDFRKTLPAADIYVYNNNSTDKTVEIALSAGAIVRNESIQGKGNVIKRMFSDIEADYYVLVDGDDTYHPGSVLKLLDCIIVNHLDMVNAARNANRNEAYRRGHRFGNLLFSQLVRFLFGDQFKDILSGYRVFSRRFVKSFPAFSEEFEIESEMTIHALEMHMPVAEISTPYKERPKGSNSKLHTYKDGFAILMTILNLIKRERPLAFFFFLFISMSTASVLLSIPIINEYLTTGLVPRFPTAILCTGMMILAFIFLLSGLIIDAVTHSRRELKRLAYLSYQNNSSRP